MTALLDRPLFTWITLEHRATLDGRIEVRYEPYLVLDPQAVGPFVAVVGARRWRILETLALLSEPAPEHEWRRVVKATIPELLAACSGPDTGWSESTMSSVIKSLEEDGYLVRELGPKRGRSGGQGKTTWILADGLFAMPADSGTVVRSDTNMAAGARSPKNRDPHPQDPEIYEAQNLGPIQQPDPLVRKAPQISGPQTFSPHHEYAWMNNSSMATMDVAPATLAAGTTNDLLTMAVTKALRDYGWTTDIAASIRRHGLLRTAAFTWYAANPAHGIKSPGAFIRTRLNDSPDAWPDTWVPGSQIAVSETGAIVVASTHSPAPPQPPEISTSQIMEIFTSLPPAEQARLRTAAAAHLPIDPSARPEAWRTYLKTVFAASGLLEAAS